MLFSWHQLVSMLFSHLALLPSHLQLRWSSKAPVILRKEKGGFGMWLIWGIFGILWDSKSSYSPRHMLTKSQLSAWRVLVSVGTFIGGGSQTHLSSVLVTSRFLVFQERDTGTSSAGMSRNWGWDCVGKWILCSVRWILLLQEQDLRILNRHNHMLKGSRIFFCCGFFCCCCFLSLHSKWKVVLARRAVHLQGQEMLWLLVGKWGKRCWGGQRHPPALHVSWLGARWLPLSLQQSQFRCWEQPCYHRNPILPCQASWRPQHSGAALPKFGEEAW